MALTQIATSGAATRYLALSTDTKPDADDGVALDSTLYETDLHRFWRFDGREWLLEDRAALMAAETNRLLQALVNLGYRQLDEQQAIRLLLSS